MFRSYLLIFFSVIEDDKIESKVESTVVEKSSFKQIENNAPIIKQPSTVSFQQMQQPNPVMFQQKSSFIQQPTVLLNQNSSTSFQPFLQNQSNKSTTQSFQNPSNSFGVVNNQNLVQYPQIQQSQSISNSNSNSIRNSFVNVSGQTSQLSQCSHCSVKLEGGRYECINCPRAYHLCDTCFEFRSQVHPSHLFQKK